MSRSAAAGDSTMCPSAATWTSPIRSSGGVGLTRNQAAPARAARSRLADIPTPAGPTPRQLDLPASATILPIVDVRQAQAAPI
jgi:hypothetical protein